MTRHRRRATPEVSGSAAGEIWSADLVVPVSSPPVRGGALAVRDGRILAVGPQVQVRREHPGLLERALGAVVLAPGFVDAHCHLEWSLTVPRPTPDFATWMAGFLAMRRSMRPDDHLTAARLGALRRLEAGTTTVADNGPTGVGACALNERGMRGVVHLETFGNPPAGEPATAQAEAVAAAIGDLSQEGVEIGLSPHAPYTVGPALWAALAAHPDLADRRWSTHLAESPAERRWLERGDGPLGEAYAPLGVVPARWPPGAGGVVSSLERAGALEPNLVAAHCIRLEEGEPESLASHAVAVAHCPSSNRQLLCGRMPITSLRKAGVQIALGTDSPASGGPFSLREEARACRRLHAASGEAPSAEELVRMLTEKGADAIGLGKVTGHLAPGMAADAVALTLSHDDPWEAVLHEDAHVEVVWTGGAEAWRRGSPRSDVAAIETAADETRARLCYQSVRAP